MRDRVQSFRDLIVWQKGVNLAVLVYELTRLLPKSETYGLSSQMQRAAVSVPSNIAEGYRRNNTKEYRHFCALALGSAAELETQLIIAKKVYPCISYSAELSLCVEVQKILTAIIKKLSP
jgi:four helix bundle protein